MNIRVIISILLLLGSIFSIHAQEDLELVSITIIDDATLDEIFLMDFEAELAPYGIEIVFTELNEQYPANTILSIQVDDTLDSIVLISFPKTRYFADLSPILQSNTVIISSVPAEDTDTLIMGLILYSTGNLEEAENLLLSVADDTESLYYESVMFLMGNIRLLQEDFDSAIEFYETIDRSRVISNLVWTYHHVERGDEAYELLTYDIDRYRNGSNRILLTNLLPIRARLYALDFDYDSAIADMDEAISIQGEIQPNNNHALAYLYTIRGEIIFLIYEWDRVEENFNTAIELDSDYAPVYFQRGVLFYTMVRREDALADFEMYLELEPNGIYAEDAIANIESIQIEIEALGN